MLDETTNPQPTDPPTGTGGGGGNLEEPETADVQPPTDPPTGTGGGGS
jgi:hypothetical protein